MMDNGRKQNENIATELRNQKRQAKCQTLRDCPDTKGPLTPAATTILQVDYDYVIKQLVSANSSDKAIKYLTLISKAFKRNDKQLSHRIVIQMHNSEVVNKIMRHMLSTNLRAKYLSGLCVCYIIQYTCINTLLKHALTFNMFRSIITYIQSKETLLQRIGLLLLEKICEHKRFLPFVISSSHIFTALIVLFKNGRKCKEIQNVMYSVLSHFYKSPKFLPTLQPYFIYLIKPVVSNSSSFVAYKCLTIISDLSISNTLNLHIFYYQPFIMVLRGYCNKQYTIFASLAIKIIGNLFCGNSLAVDYLLSNGGILDDIYGWLERNIKASKICCSILWIITNIIDTSDHLQLLLDRNVITLVYQALKNLSNYKVTKEGILVFCNSFKHSNKAQLKVLLEYRVLYQIKTFLELSENTEDIALQSAILAGYNSILTQICNLSNDKYLRVKHKILKQLKSVGCWMRSNAAQDLYKKYYVEINMLEYQ